MKRSAGYSIPSRSSEEKPKAAEKSKFSKLDPKGSKNQDEPTEDVSKNMLFESVINPGDDSIQQGAMTNEFGDLGQQISEAGKVDGRNFLFATKVETRLTKNPNELEESFELPGNQILKGNQFSSPQVSGKIGVESSNSLLQSPVKVPVRIST